MRSATCPATASRRGPGASVAVAARRSRSSTGQINLPVLVLDEGKTVVGSGKIVDWAKAHPAYQPEVGGG